MTPRRQCRILLDDLGFPSPKQRICRPLPHVTTTIIGLSKTNLRTARRNLIRAEVFSPRRGVLYVFKLPEPFYTTTIEGGSFANNTYVHSGRVRITHIEGELIYCTQLILEVPVGSLINHRGCVHILRIFFAQFVLECSRTK